MGQIQINNVQQGLLNKYFRKQKKETLSKFNYSDTALNLAVHRQKYHIVDLLLKYHANPNIHNQSGKTALHRAVASYIDDNANHIRTLLHV